MFSSLIILAMFLWNTQTATLRVITPKQFTQQHSINIEVYLSPIGFRPLSGSLEGRIIVADPADACSTIQNLHSVEEDIFVLANDATCLESVKAKNIAASGSYVGIIRQNINNTLHDKEINLVHIPILEMQPNDFDKIVKTASNQTVRVSIDFIDQSQTHDVNMEVWFSPTQVNSYQFFLEMREFIDNQESLLSFAPHYVLQSQRQIKDYIGCLSSGRYCPVQIEYQGKKEGVNVVEESLRQIIVWKMSKSKWWRYIKHFSSICISNNNDIFLNKTNLLTCSESCLIMAGISLPIFRDEYSQSFIEPYKSTSDNTYLLEERQHYIKEQINSHPITLINKKKIKLNVEEVKERICKLQSTNPSSQCKVKGSLNMTQILIFTLIMLGIFIVIAGLYRLYLYFQMRSQIKSEVDQTLEQYYKYLDTFEGKDGEVIQAKKNIKYQKSKKLNENLEQINESSQVEKREKQEEEIEMGKLSK